MYKAILFHPEGDFVTDFKEETKDEVWQCIENMGSKWIFYPIPFIIKDTFPNQLTNGVVDTPEGLEHLKGKKVKTIQKHLEERWSEDAQEICDILNEGAPLELIY